MTGPRDRREQSGEPDLAPPGRVQRKTQLHPEAVLSFGLSLIGLLGIASALAVIRGRRAVAEIEAEPERFHGRGLAKTGIALGYVGLALFAVVYVYLGAVLLSDAGAVNVRPTW